MKPIRMISKLVAISAVLTSGASAALVASYNFTTNFSSSDSDLLSTASAIGSGAGAVRALSTTNATNGQFMTISSNVSTTGLAAAVTNNVFFNFTVTPVSGASISFDNISGLVRRSATSSVRGFRIISDKTGSTVLAEDSAVAASRGGPFENFTPDSGTLTLSGVSALQNVTTATTFTVFVNPGSSGTDGRTLDFDSIAVNATVVPEPSTALLSCVGALALLRRKR